PRAYPTLPTAPAGSDRHHISRGIDDSLDQGRQTIECLALFRQIVMPIVDALDAGNNVGKTPLRDVATYARSLHECLGRSAQIAVLPWLQFNKIRIISALGRVDAQCLEHKFIETALEFAPPIDRL